MSQGRISTCHDSHGIALCYELYHRGYNIMDGLRLKDPKQDQIVELDTHLRIGYRSSYSYCWITWELSLAWRRLCLSGGSGGFWRLCLTALCLIYLRSSAATNDVAPNQDAR